MEYLNSDEKLTDFPKKYNKHVRATRALTYFVFILSALIIILFLKTFGDTKFSDIFDSLGLREIIIGVVIVGIGHLFVRKIIDPLFL